MNNARITAVLFIIFTTCAAGQERPEHVQRDTVRVQFQRNPSAFMFDMPAQLLPLSVELALTPDYYKSIVFQETGGEPYFFSKHEASPPDLAAPWKLQLARESEHKLLYQVLGAVEAGGVAYLAYQHVKKYGWK